MMKNYLALLLVVILNALMMPQNKANVNLGIGFYVNNSENSMRIMRGEKYHSYFQYGFTYERENFYGCDLQFDYSFHQNTKEHLLQFAILDEDGTHAVGMTPGDVSLRIHNFDVSYTKKMDKYFTWGAGPSFALINRIIDVQNHLYDKLASSGLGVNAFLEFSIPFNPAKPDFYFTSNMKFRYLHSIWFDKGNRNLDDYSQWFLTSELTVGIGYAF